MPFLTAFCRDGESLVVHRWGIGMNCERTEIATKHSPVFFAIFAEAIRGIPPKKMALQWARMSKKQRPVASYVKEVFQYVRLELGLRGSALKTKKLPDILTERELVRFNEAVLNAMDRTHVVMIKLLIFTAIRNSELASLGLEDVDLNWLKI
jgi:integrase